MSQYLITGFAPLPLTHTAAPTEKISILIKITHIHIYHRNFELKISKFKYSPTDVLRIMQ